MCDLCTYAEVPEENLSLYKTLFLVLKLNGSFGMNLALVYSFMLADLSRSVLGGKGRTVDWMFEQKTILHIYLSSLLALGNPEASAQPNYSAG